jgi:hypothetical protein
MSNENQIIPKWMRQDKTIRQLIQELQTFEDQNLIVKLSIDDFGELHNVNLVGKENGYCVIASCKITSE